MRASRASLWRGPNVITRSMFSAFSRRVPQISIFHHPRSPPSVSALAMLRAALSGPPTSPDTPPLDFYLDVIESTPPTPDQLVTILSYLAPKDDPPSYTAFLSSHPSAPGPGEQPQTAAGVAELGARNPNALQWPIVVDWNGGRASIGNVQGVARMLEALRRGRESDMVQPKGWFS